jgi:hypothetical protein
VGLLRIAAGAGVRGVLKGCATPGLEVAEGAPEDERGVAVVEVSEVVGVEYGREGVMVRERVKVEEGVVRRERRVRQRVQIMVVVVCCVGRGFLGCDRPMDFGNWYGSSRFRLSQSGRLAEVTFGEEIWHVTMLTILHRRYINLCI